MRLAPSARGSGDQSMGGAQHSGRSRFGRKPLSCHGWALACLGCLPSSIAFAADAPHGDSPKSETPAPYWSGGSARPFISGRAIPGFGYGRFALTTGYGRPHWLWAGAEGLATLTPMYTAVQAGLHASLVVVDLMLTIRRTYAFDHTLIPMADSLGSADLNQPGQPAAKSTVIDASLWGLVPYGRWLLTWDLTYVRPLGQASSMLLYEEIQRAVIASEGVVTLKLGPMVNLSASGQVYAGVLAEHLSLLGRNDSLVFRLGPNVWIELSRHWNLFGYCTWPVHGPDHLGAWSGMYGAGGFLYRFATGESQRQLP